MKLNQSEKRTSLRTNCQKSVRRFVLFVPLKQYGVQICKSVGALISCLHNKCHALRIPRPGDKRTDFCSNVHARRIPEGIDRERSLSNPEDSYVLYLRQHALNEL